jgi:hypothetical protein
VLRSLVAVRVGQMAGHERSSIRFGLSRGSRASVRLFSQTPPFPASKNRPVRGLIWANFRVSPSKPSLQPTPQKIAAGQLSRRGRLTANSGRKLVRWARTVVAQSRFDGSAKGTTLISLSSTCEGSYSVPNRNRRIRGGSAHLFVAVCSCRPVAAWPQLRWWKSFLSIVSLSAAEPPPPPLWSSELLSAKAVVAVKRAGSAGVALPVLASACRLSPVTSWSLGTDTTL